MKSLSHYWIAYFKDDTKIEQFENNIEHRFQEVKDKFNELNCFCLYKKDQSQLFKVYLPEGIITEGNDKNIKLIELKENCRLIFFRRHKIELTEKMIEKSHSIEYHLGFQYNDKLGNNRKIILIIDENGSWSLGE
jgi:hypothetical protein